MTKISEEEPERYSEILKAYNQVLKLGAIETAVEGKNSNRDKLAGLTRFEIRGARAGYVLTNLDRWDTTLRQGISLQDYIDARKEGQNQVRINRLFT
jgi:HSP90 family molecular chaperone